MSSIDDAREILAKCLFVAMDSIHEEDIIVDIKPIDSLTFETIMLEVEKKTDRDLEPSEILNLQTVADLANIISGKNNA